MKKTGLISLVCLALIGRAIAADSESEVPIHTVAAHLEKHALRSILEQLREYNDERGFAVRISQSSSDPEDLLLQMWRSDMKIFGADASDEGAADTRYVIAIFRNCNDGVPEWAFTKVATDLKTVLSAMEGVVSVESE